MAKVTAILYHPPKRGSARMMTDPLIFTHNAAAKVLELIQEEGNPDLKLRAYVTGGGCSGFQYGFTFDEAIQPDDTVVSKVVDAATVQLLVDPLSFQYLAGAEIDYKEDIEGEQFIIRNPNAKTTCGCGSSFATE
jgi:iron-sulfur cluster insertion protein